MKNNSFISFLCSNFSFFQVIFYISFFLFEESLCSCKSNSTTINNIINVGPQYFRYINFASYSNGDMVFLTTSFKQNDRIENSRKFYGIKRNGRPLFNNDYFYSNEINEISKQNGKYESESLVVKESGNSTNKTEYLMSVSKYDSFVEIYDFENETIYKKELEKFTNNTIKSFRHAFISLFSNDTNYFYLLGFIKDGISSKNIYLFL